MLHVLGLEPIFCEISIGFYIIAYGEAQEHIKNIKKYLQEQLFCRKQIEIDSHYRSYLERQELDIKAFRRDQVLAIPVDLNLFQKKILIFDCDC